MGTLYVADHPKSRIDAGSSILHAAEHADTKPIAGRLAAFTKIHKVYCKADEEVKAASEALLAQQRKVAEEDVEQDADVNGLASALVGEGLSRQNPFKELKFASPSEVCAMGYEREANVVIKLADAVEKRKGAGKASKAAADKARASAKRVLAAMKPIAKLEKGRSDAIAKRNALEQPWETAFAALKRGAKAAEDDGAKGLYNALFVRPSSKSTKKRAPKAAKAGSKKPAAPKAGAEG